MTSAPELRSAAEQCAPRATGSECCSLSGGPMTADEARRIAGRLKALSDPTRLRLLSHVAAQGCGPVCVCDLTAVVDIGQPTVSHHMKRLVDAGLVTREQRGKWAHYSVVPEAFAELRSFLDLGRAGASTAR
jgi:ArsR family transcriptional regulator